MDSIDSSGNRFQATLGSMGDWKRQTKKQKNAKKKSALNAWVPSDSLDVAVDVTASRARVHPVAAALSRI